MFYRVHHFYRCQQYDIFPKKIMLFLSYLFASALSGAPVPNRPTGVVWNGDVNDIILEMYGDPLCPDCLMVWNTTLSVVEHYKEHLQLRLHLLPLPYHTWSFIVTKSIMAVKSISEAKAQDYVNALYNGGQDQFENEPLSGTGQEQVIEKVLDYAASVTSIDKTELQNAYSSNEMNARIEFKYACVHSVAGTPTFFVNGVEVELGGDATLEDFEAIIDPLLN